LLASGYHNPENGALGSGIYHGASVLNMTYNGQSGSKLITAKIPNHPAPAADLENSRTIPAAEFRRKNPFYLYEDLSKYSKLVIMESGSHSVNLSHIDEKTGSRLVCQFNYESANLSKDQFQLLAFSGIRTFGGGTFKGRIQVCGLAPICLNCSSTPMMQMADSSFFSFQKLEIKGHFKPGLKAMPVGLDQHYFPILNFDYQSCLDNSSNFVQLKLAYPTKLFSAALYGRDFSSRDDDF
jgi:hypothetical protein